MRLVRRRLRSSSEAPSARSGCRTDRMRTRAPGSRAHRRRPRRGLAAVRAPGPSRPPLELNAIRAG